MILDGANLIIKIGLVIIFFQMSMCNHFWLVIIAITFTITTWWKTFRAWIWMTPETLIIWIETFLNTNSLVFSRFFGVRWRRLWFSLSILTLASCLVLVSSINHIVVHLALKGVVEHIDFLDYIVRSTLLLLLAGQVGFSLSLRCWALRAASRQWRMWW